MSESKLEKFRNILKNEHIDAFIIPTSDPHKSEYIADYWKLREWISGFSGSAGTAVITQNHAGLWTDSRYFVQAEKQLHKPFVLHKLKTRGPEYIDWLLKNLNPKYNVGFDPRLFSASEVENLTNRLNTKQIQIVPTSSLFNDIWKNRPPLPNNLIINHDTNFNELTRLQKIEKIRTHIKENDSKQIIISSLDDIAWLLNLRGSDIKYNPVFSAFVLINHNDCYLFVDGKKLTPEAQASLKKDKITIKPYSEIENHLKTDNSLTNIEVDADTINYSIIKSIPQQCKIKLNKSIVTKLKAIKSKIEIGHYKNAQIRDGLAMCNFLHWLDTHIKTDSITEIDAAKKSEEFRSVQDNYMGLSFEVISAYQENAALPHYSPDSEKPVLLKPKGMYLVDSGAQYLDGTTDITRTVALGEITPQQKTDFTLVLKGHIRLATAKFPFGTKGFHLDTLARLDLWQHGKDYGHGTGHGIGYFLNVHEGPQGFSQAQTGTANTVIEPGMLITDEPGIYIEGKYGIRIENVLACVEDNSAAEGKFLKFETVTYCPIDKRLIDIPLLTDNEKHWINSYHKQVYELISPIAPELIQQWLKENTLPLL